MTKREQQTQEALRDFVLTVKFGYHEDHPEFEAFVDDLARLVTMILTAYGVIDEAQKLLESVS